MKLNSATKLVGLSVVLVPYKEKHVQKYHEWMKNEELLDLTGSEPLTLEQEYEMQESWFNDDDKCTFIVLDKQTLCETKDEIDSMIGDVNLYFNDQDDPNVAEIEIMIAETKHRCKGKGKEALLLMMHYGVAALKIKKFVAKIKMKNGRSIQLFSKLGFTERDRSNFFQEIEMMYDVNEIDNVFRDTSYEVQEYSEH